jgi:hypothetical protein
MARSELKATLAATNGGTPNDLAQAAGVGPRDSSFRRALAELVEEGVFEARGSTNARHYARPGSEPSEVETETEVETEADLDSIDAALLAAVPCTARQFSDVCDSLDLDPKLAGARKLALGIETYKEKDGGRWHCRATGHPLPVPRVAFKPGARAESFGVMAANASKLSGGRPFGAVKTPKA